MLKTLTTDTWTSSPSKETHEEILSDIESGNVIFLPQLGFTVSPEERKFLTESCADPKSKNINYDPKKGILRGSVCTGHDLELLKGMVVRFASQARELMDSLLPHYKNNLKEGRTSFRPVEILGRKVPSYRKDDTRLHVDSFASKPVQGLRLLRVFTNINPYEQPRLWRLGEPFESVAQRFLPQITHRQWISPTILQKLGITKGRRTLYDHLMLQIHDTMKGDTRYQQSVPQKEVPFPSNSTWIVMTDSVSHAAMSGQFLLEQTFYLPVEAMKNPELSPLRVLEKMVGKTLAA